MPKLKFEGQINIAWESHRKEKGRWEAGSGRWTTLNKGIETILNSFGVLGHWNIEAIVADEAGKSNLAELRMIWSVKNYLIPHPCSSWSQSMPSIEALIDEGEAWAGPVTPALPLSCVVEWPWSHFPGDWDSLSRRPAPRKAVLWPGPKSICRFVDTSWCRGPRIEIEQGKLTGTELTIPEGVQDR